MSADEMHTQFQQERTEMITQADILKRLVDIQDSQYQLDQMLRGLCAWAAAHDSQAAKPPLETASH